MSDSDVFERVEMKYLMSRSTEGRILEKPEPYMEPDRYGRALICNLYYDTPDFRLIRRSLDHPRMRGVNVNKFVPSRNKFGSSPHVRG